MNTGIWFPLSLCKQHIELGVVKKHYMITSPEEEYKITFYTESGGYIELYKFNSCCEFFETSVEPLYKKLLEDKKIKQIQEDFE